MLFLLAWTRARLRVRVARYLADERKLDHYRRASALHVLAEAAARERGLLQR
jgi:hypothetical protein